MSARLATLLGCGLMLGAAEPPEAVTWPVALQTEVVKLARSFEGELAVYVKDLPSGVRYTYNAATPMYLASVVKLPMLVALYDRLARGELRLDDELVVTSADLRDGSPVVNDHEGESLTVARLAELMMMRSDNGATDLLVERIGLSSINEVLAGLGVPGFRPLTSLIDVRRQVYGNLHPDGATLSAAQYIELRDVRPLGQRGKLLARMLGLAKGFSAREVERAFERYYATQLNSAPLEAVGQLLEAMVQGRVVSPEASAEMLALMRRCETGAKRLRGELPAEVAVAHKTGTQHRRICDVGVMYLAEDHPVVIAVCVKDFGPLAPAERVIARVARSTYDLLSAP